MKRIQSHPVLGEMDERPRVSIFFEGRAIEAFEGEPIAAALEAAGIADLRYSHRFNQPRGIYCGIGQCQECVMIVDGVPNVRTCVTPVEEGMRIERQHGRGRMDVRE
jgi:sarcosine oxidase subunit alpha